MNQEHVIHR